MVPPTFSFPLKQLQTWLTPIIRTRQRTTKLLALKNRVNTLRHSVSSFLCPFFLYRSVTCLSLVSSFSFSPAPFSESSRYLTSPTGMNQPGMNQPKHISPYYPFQNSKGESKRLVSFHQTQNSMLNWWRGKSITLILTWFTGRQNDTELWLKHVWGNMKFRIACSDCWVTVIVCSCIGKLSYSYSPI